LLVVNHDRMMPCRDRKLPAWVTQEKTRDSSVNSSPVSADEEDCHCVCREPWGGRFMIMCDFCETWYHGSCVNVSPTDALDIDKYRCTVCKGNN